MSRRGFNRLASLVVTASGVVSAVRLSVLFFESWSRVAGERASDARLLEICRDQETAAASTKFQTACIAARADGAAPIILKAFLFALSTVFEETLEVFSSPSRVAVIITLLISGVSAPVVRIFFATLVAGLRSQREEEDEEKLIVQIENNTRTKHHVD